MSKFFVTIPGSIYNVLICYGMVLILTLLFLNSKLTQYSDCCSIIGKDTSDLGLLVQAMKFHHTRQVCSCSSSFSFFAIS